FDLDVLSAKSHVSAEAFDLFLLGEDVDDLRAGARVKLAAVCVGDAAQVACELDHGHLKAEAQAEVRDPVLACVADAFDLAFGAADAKAAGDDDAVAPAEICGNGGRIDVRRIEPFQVDVRAQVHAAVFAGFDDAGVGVAK